MPSVQFEMENGSDHLDTQFDTEERGPIGNNASNKESRKKTYDEFGDENEGEYEDESDEYFDEEDEAEFYEHYDDKSIQEREVNSLASKLMRYIVYLLLFSYIAAVIIIDYERAMMILVLAMLAIVYNVIVLLSASFPDKIDEFEQGMIDFMDRIDTDAKVGAPIIVIMIVIMVILALFVVRDLRNLRSLVGILGYILLSYIFSHNRSAIRWRPVIGAFFTQYVFGFIVLRTDWGRDVIEYVATKTTLLLDYTFEGSSFVYGYLVDESLGSTPFRLVEGNSYFLRPPLFFDALQTIIFFSSLISVLYHLNLIQVIVKSLGYVLSIAFGISASESLSTMGNIFMGQTEAPLIIKPFISEMTESELLTVMAGGFSTVAGSILGVYISFGIDAKALLAASTMSAPAALAIAKVIYPETESSKTDFKVKESWKMPQSKEKNVIHAASVGAFAGAQIVLKIAANLISILAMLKMLDAWLLYLGGLIDIHLSFNAICEVVFYPIAWMMGIDNDDLRIAAILIGYKVFANEFVAFQFLAFTYKDLISPRSYYILSFALCGFANVGSVGVQLATLTHLAPEREDTISKLALRAVIAGNFASYMTACVAGLFYEINEEGGM